MLTGNKWTCMVTVCLLLTLFISISARTNDSDEVVQIITGYVIPADWNADDEVIAVAIRVGEDPMSDPGIENETDMDAEEYLVVQNEKANELLELIDELIEAKGTVTIDENDIKTITVTWFRILAGEEELLEEESEPDPNH